MIDQLLDPAWRVANIYSIVDKNARRIKFKQNNIQKLISDNQSNRKIVLKARQFGVSTGEIIKQFDETIWNENVTSCILAHERDGIEKLFRIVRRAYEFLDPRIRPQLDRGGGSKYEMFFPEINSRIYCDLESRGDTIHRLHISEAAFFKDPDRLKSTLQAVPVTGKVTIETTANGMNHFYDMWMDPKQPYEKLFFPWYLFPEYSIDIPRFEFTDDEVELIEKVKDKWGLELTEGQIGFRRLKQGELRELFPQEYPEDDQSCFLASGNSAMDLVLVKEVLDQCKPPIERDEFLSVYERPFTEGKYVIGADCAEGVGSDYSVATVIEAKSLRQVAVLRGHMKPSAFARRLAQLGDRYTVRATKPKIAVERNNHGHAVILELDEHIRYQALYVSKDDRLGWLTDRVSRPIMVDAFIDAVEHRHLKIMDAETARECLTLVDNNGKIEAGTGKNDDCVIATAIALQLALEHSKASNLYENISSRILS